MLLILAGLWLWLRKRGQALFYIVASGVIYGFVATLAKVAIERIKANDFDWLTILCIVALLAAVAIGAYFVQTAYAVGPPDLVIAGLTVIDPIVAVVIGLTILQEAANAPVWAFFGFAVAGAIAVTGVITLARHHPQLVADSLELPIQRGSDRVSRVGRRHDRLTADTARRRAAAIAVADLRMRRGTSMTRRPSSSRPAVARRGRRSGELDLRLPFRVSVLRARAPDGIHARAEPTGGAPTFQLPAALIALERRCARDEDQPSQRLRGRGESTRDRSMGALSLRGGAGRSLRPPGVRAPCIPGLRRTP